MKDEKELDPSVFFKYISLKVPDERSMSLYKEAVELQGIPLGRKELKLYRLSTKYPFLIPYFDGGLALTDANSSYRQRLYLVLSILETRPEHFSRLSSSSDRSSSKISFAKAVFIGVRAAFRGVVGAILVKLL